MAKRGPKIDLSVAAQILVDASLLGDEAAAKRHNVSTKTVSRYRALSASDENLSKLVATFRARVETAWAEDLGIAIKGQIDFLKRAAHDASTKDPIVIAAVANALETLADIALTSRMIDARLAEQGGSAREEARSPDADEADEGAIH